MGELAFVVVFFAGLFVCILALRAVVVFRRSRRSAIASLALFAACFLCFLWGVFVEPHRLEVTEHVVETTKLPPGVKLRIAHVSDLHVGIGSPSAASAPGPLSRGTHARRTGAPAILRRDDHDEPPRQEVRDGSLSSRGDDALREPRHRCLAAARTTDPVSVSTRSHHHRRQRSIGPICSMTRAGTTPTSPRASSTTKSPVSVTSTAPTRSSPFHTSTRLSPTGRAS